MSKMKTEEDKYVYQQQQTLLDMKTKNGHVYNETTVKSQQTTGKKTSCMSSHLFSRLQIILASLAIVTCLIVIAILMTSGIKASNNREQSQEEEIAMLKELVENQQSRLHRMQKELQFLVTRQKAYEAKEDSFRRRQLPIISSAIGTGTGSHVWPSLVDKPSVTVGTFLAENNDDQDKLLVADSELPLIPRREEMAPIIPIQEEDVDVDKLPRASANKKRKGKILLDDQQL